MSILLYLQERGVVSDSQAAEVSSRALEQNTSIESVLLDEGIDEVLLQNTIADYYQVPPFSIPEGFESSQEVLSYVPEDSAYYYKIAPLSVADGVLMVGVNDPDDLKVREVLNFVSTKHNMPFKMVFMLERDIKKAQQFYENLKGDVNDALGTLESELDTEIEKNKAEGDEGEQQNLEHIKEDAPVTKIVATILRYAVDGNASDIHVEPTEKKVVVRFRVDGELSTSLELPKNVQMAVAARIKILASMRLDERRKPQDGRFSATFDGRKN